VVVQKKVVLFVCTHNSARSQLAEAILRQKYHKFYQVFSAGTQPTDINPYILQILIDMGIDTSKLESKHVNMFLGKEIDFVVTVCNSAQETCPFFPNAKQYLHKNFDDPNSFTGTAENIFKEVNRVKKEIADWIEEEFAPKQKQM
jgi:arsenate reductase